MVLGICLQRLRCSVHRGVWLDQKRPHGVAERTPCISCCSCVWPEAGGRWLEEQMDVSWRKTTNGSQRSLAGSHQDEQSPCLNL